MTRIYSENINHLDLEKRFFGFEQQNRTLAGWKGVSVPTEPIRVIIVIVGHPREVFDGLSATRLLSNHLVEDRLEVELKAGANNCP